MRSLYSKKAQIGNLQGIILTLIVVGILIGVGFLIFDEFKTNLRTETGRVNNETLTTVGNVNSVERISSNIYSISCFDSFKPLQVTNFTSGTLIGSDNYTYSSNGTIWYIGVSNTAGFNNSNWNVTYTYAYGREGCGGIEDVEITATTITTWLPIIVILLVVGILLVIVFNVLPSSGGSSGESSGRFSFGRGSGGTTAEI